MNLYEHLENFSSSLNDMKSLENLENSAMT